MADIARLMQYRDKAEAQYREAVRCSRLGGSYGHGEELDRLAAQEDRFYRRYREAQQALDLALGAQRADAS